MVRTYDVAIVGAGPAGLSAALLLSRCCRSIILFDHGKPRNKVAHAVNCYLGLEGLSPNGFREVCQRQVATYGADFVDNEVIDARQIAECAAHFALRTSDGVEFFARKLLLATGTRDQLPDVKGINGFYGTSVHHCPYCDGWEHRGRRLVALGASSDAVELALSLRAWSTLVTACSDGEPLSPKDQAQLSRNNIRFVIEKPLEFEGDSGQLRAVRFPSGARIECDALFFSSSQVQCCDLAQQLGCTSNERGLMRSSERQSTNIPGLFLAGDTNGGVQFAIVAASEGAIAATAINHELQREDSMQGESFESALR